MQSLKAETAEFAGLPDLKPILSGAGPCVSMYLNLKVLPANQAAKFEQLEWRELLDSIEAKLNDVGPEGREIFASLKDWEAIISDQSPQAKALAVLRSPDVFRVVWLHTPVGANQAVVGPHFFIRPLLAQLTRPKTFYLLALSQKDVRLLRCTDHSSEGVSMPSPVATSYDAYMNTAKPDHNDIDRTSAGPSAGHTKGIIGSFDTTRENKPEYLAHFFRQIDRGINEILRGSANPLVLAGVEYEVAQYADLSTYPHLSEVNVHGAPNSLKAGEMHARALEALDADADKKADTTLAEYDHKVGGGASSHIKDIVTAAHDGRVLKLMLSDTLEKMGSFDETRHAVKSHANLPSEEEDLLNNAAVQTILHGGEVLSLSNKKMPNGAPMAAIFRY